MTSILQSVAFLILVASVVPAYGQISKQMGTIDPALESIDVEWEWKNTAEKALVIRRVVPSCTCTKVDYPNQSIEPGGVGKFKGKVDLRGRYGRVQTGFVAVFESDHDPIEFSVSLFRQRPLVADPSSVAFEDLSDSKDASRTVRLQYYTEEEKPAVVALQDTYRSKSGKFVCHVQAPKVEKLLAASKDGRNQLSYQWRHSVLFTITPAADLAPCNVCHDEIAIQVKVDGREHELKVPIRYRRHTMVYGAPESLVVVATDSGTAEFSFFILRRDDVKGVRNLQVSSDDPRVTLEVKSSGGGPAKSIGKVVGTVRSVGEAIESKITVLYDLGNDGKSIVLPIKVIRLSPQEAK